MKNLAKLLFLTYGFYILLTIPYLVHIFTWGKAGIDYGYWTYLASLVSVIAAFMIDKHGEWMTYQVDRLLVHLGIKWLKCTRSVYDGTLFTAGKRYKVEKIDDKFWYITDNRGQSFGFVRAKANFFYIKDHFNV